MLPPKIVLCPVDFSDLSRQELALAVEVCEGFGARLVLHHNQAAVSPGLTRAWEWNELHRADAESSDKANARLRALLADLPKTVSATATVSAGPVGPVLLELAAQLPADLVVLGSHGWSTADHASVTERIIASCPCPVLTLHEGDEVARRFRLRAAGEGEVIRVVVPTDLSPSAGTAVEYAFALARALPIELHLLHVAARGRLHGELQAAEVQLRDLVPAELMARVQCHIQQGESVDVILRFSQRLEPAFMVMGEHARGFLRRFFTRDTAREVLHRAPCPVWFVPPQRGRPAP